MLDYMPGLGVTPDALLEGPWCEGMPLHITLGYPWYPLSEVELALVDFWMNFQDFASMLVPDITHLTIKVTPMQIYAYVCGAGVYACVFNNPKVMDGC